MQRYNQINWSVSHAAHLLNRAGFGGSPAENEQLYSLGHEGAVEYLISGLTAEPSTAPPENIEAQNLLNLRQTMRGLAEEEKREHVRELRRTTFRETGQLRDWWMKSMRETASPLREKLGLFWHGHFATSIRKVREPFLMLQQLRTFHEHGHGTFDELVKHISKDPAMLVWLDGANSRKGKPNENFARELMELFTLGEGNYTEADIQEAARAFTGYRIDPRSRTFRLVPRQQDRDPKTIFGLTQNFSGDMVIEAIGRKKECSEFLATRLWNYFASDSHQAIPVKDLADIVRDENFSIADVLHRLFTSSAFYEPTAVANQIKSPVQWLIQLTRSFEMPLPEHRRTMMQFQQLGQILLAPPNVRGWIGGRAWITPSSLVARQNLANEILNRQLKPETCRSWIADIEPASPAVVERLSARVFCRPMRPEFHAKVQPAYLAMLEENPNSAAKNFVIHLTSLPEYQLT